MTPGDEILAMGASAMDASTDPELASILAEAADRYRRGDTPSLEEYAGLHPEHAERLATLWPTLRLMAQIVGPGTRRDGDPTWAGWLAPHPSAGDRLDDFRIIREVGRGGMGIVYEAEQVSLGRRVALKVLPPAMASDPQRIQRFQVETQAVASLNHPSIVPIYAVGHDRGTSYFVMRLIEGRTLAEIARASRSSTGQETVADEPNQAVRGSRSLPPTERCEAADAESPPTEATPTTPGRQDLALRDTRPRAKFDHRAIAGFGVQAAEALAHVHGLGILHRDIKPANLLVDNGGRLWITDFGMARLQGESDLTHTGDLIGTLKYMSPEQAMGRRERIDERSDLYSLGATLYESLTLRPAFEGADRQELLRMIIEGAPRPLRAIDPTIPPDLETIVLKALSREPEGRYPTALALAEDLRRFLNDEPILARPIGLIGRMKRLCLRPQRIREAGYALLSLGLLTTGIGALWFIGYLIGLVKPARPGDFQLDLLTAFLVFDAPPIWCGIRTLAGKGYGLWLGLLTSVNFLAWLLVGLSGWQVFDYGGVFEDKTSESPFILILMLLVAHTVVRVSIGLAAHRAIQREPARIGEVH